MQPYPSPPTLTSSTPLPLLGASSSWGGLMLVGFWVLFFFINRACVLIISKFLVNQKLLQFHVYMEPADPAVKIPLREQVILF